MMMTAQVYGGKGETTSPHQITFRRRFYIIITIMICHGSSAHCTHLNVFIYFTDI